VDFDPGVGNATAITIVPGDTLELDLDLQMTGVTTGNHTVSVRVKNEDEIWSLAEADTFNIVDCDLPGKPSAPAVLSYDNAPEFYTLQVPLADIYF